MKALFVFLYLFPWLLFAQQDEIDSLQKEFDSYKNQENARFEAYREKENKAFAAFLKKPWVPVQAEPEITALPTPVPDIPAEIPKPPAQPALDKIPAVRMKRPDIILPEEEITKPDNREDKIIDKNSRFIDFDFYGQTLALPYEPGMQVRVSGKSEAEVSAYWTDMSRSQYADFLNAFQKIASAQKLNDWAKYILLKSFATAFCPEPEQQVLFQFFMLNQMGYHCRIAKNGERFILLLPVKETLYGVSYTLIQGAKYYMPDLDKTQSLQTFTVNFSKRNEALSLEMEHSPILNSKGKWRKVKLKPREQYDTIPYNTHLIDFYNSVPQADLSIFFNARVSPLTENRLALILHPLLRDKNELEAVEVLLDFVQSAFPYQTDEAQFGKEKYFFVEDMFHYPYSDCEDRSVLLAWLVKTFVGLKVIGLHYDTHVSIAVKFNGPVQGDAIEYKGSRYIVADPTYIGAPVGVSMPRFKHARPEVIEVK